MLRRDYGKEKLVNYQNYFFTLPELFLNLILGVMVAYSIGHFFYDSLLVSVISLAGLPLFLNYRRKEYGRKRRDELRVQFKDAVNSVSANQKAGYSVENSFREAKHDMVLLYGEKSIICRELDYIKKGLDNNQNLEQMLVSLGRRSGLEDISQFGDIFAIAKRGGGNLTGLIEKTASVIEQKTDVEQEIEVMVSSRKMESNIMSFIPFFMILYMNITSDNFMAGLYHNIAGIAVMTVCLAVYIAAFLISRRLVDIRI